MPGRLLWWARRACVPAAGVLADLVWHLAGPAAATAVLAAAITWLAVRLPAAMITAAQASAKAYAVEKRLDSVVGQIPAPQVSPGQAADGSYGVSNSSYGVSNSSYGINNSSYGAHNLTQTQTGSQQGSGTSHYHYTQVQSDFNDLVASVNSIRDSHSNLVPAFNQLRDSHSDLVPAVNALRTSHSDLVPAVNALRNSHSGLLSTHNTLIGRLENSGLLR